MKQKIYEEIVQGNKFYSFCSHLIEKIDYDQNEILRYFSILEETVTQRFRSIILKSFIWKINNSEEGNNLLKKLIDKNSSLKKIAQEIMAK